MQQKWLYRNCLLLTAILFGAALRFYQLGEQIIADDEWHALHAARDLPFKTIAEQFGGADVSIPIALYYKTVMSTIGLSERTMHAPVVVFGLLTLLIFPLFAQRLFDRTTGTLFGWLLAICPLHIYYSRYARPYSIALFCAFCGLFAIHLWWTTARAGWKWLYGACAIVGPYFHLTVLPALYAPLLPISAMALWKRADQTLKETLRLGVIAGGTLALLLLPPIFNDFASISEKARLGTLTSVALNDAIGLQLGVDTRPVQGVMLVLMLLGFGITLRKQPRFALLTAISSAVSILLIVITRPTGIEFPIVLARYELFLLPVLLLMLAAGLSTIGMLLRGNLRVLAFVIWAGWIAALVKIGPLGYIYYAPNNFTNHGAFQYYPSFDPKRNPYVRDLSRPASPFYVELGKQPAGSLRILEAPWYIEWAYNPLPFYQRVHRQNVDIGFVKSDPYAAGELPAFDPRFSFRNFVHLTDMKGVCAHKIDRVVIHKRLSGELVIPVNREFDAELPGLIAQYQHAYGPPIFEDAQLIVFNTAAQCLASSSAQKAVP